MFEAEVAALLVLAALAAGWFMTTWGGKPVDTSSKIVFITGAGSGLGLACVRHLLRAGDTVIACDLHTAALEKMFAGGSEKLEMKCVSTHGVQMCTKNKLPGLAPH